MSKKEILVPVIELAVCEPQDGEGNPIDLPEGYNNTCLPSRNIRAYYNGSTLVFGIVEDIPKEKRNTNPEPPPDDVDKDKTKDGRGSGQRSQDVPTCNRNNPEIICRLTERNSFQLNRQHEFTQNNYLKPIPPGVPIGKTLNRLYWTMAALALAIKSSHEAMRLTNVQGLTPEMQNPGEGLDSYIDTTDVTINRAISAYIASESVALTLEQVRKYLDQQITAEVAEV